uniref:LINE-1 reverse transcriptase isogeny n=1 Tax=Cajanus cajan TaxID=3821 RepID=A0A151SLS4_CAJCA|nr:LINE-1 reverse transcriptase isogeny [Cajanus cajan]
MEFYSNVILPKTVSASFLALIPKVLHPISLTEYRPISLISSVHKIISKVLAARMKLVIGSVISRVQIAFVPRRHLLDGVLVVNELIDKKCFLFKDDFHKAYDSVNWAFLDYMLDKLGFGLLWRKWVKALVQTSSLSMLVNGSPTEEFYVEKGLKQGDPLALFLFLLVAEGLAGL